MLVCISTLLDLTERKFDVYGCLKAKFSDGLYFNSIDNTKD